MTMLHLSDQKKRVSATDTKPFIGGEKKMAQVCHIMRKEPCHLGQNPVMTPEYSKSPEVDIITQ
jgi:hypothetical protein